MKILLLSSVVAGILLASAPVSSNTSASSNLVARHSTARQLTFPVQPVFMDLRSDYFCIADPCFSDEDCILSPGTFCDLSLPVCKRYCMPPEEWH